MTVHSQSSCKALLFLLEGSKQANTDNSEKFLRIKCVRAAQLKALEGVVFFLKKRKKGGIPQTYRRKKFQQESAISFH